MSPSPANHIHVRAADTGHLGCHAGGGQATRYLAQQEQEDEIQQAPRGPGSSMSRAPVVGDQPG